MQSYRLGYQEQKKINFNIRTKHGETSYFAILPNDSFAKSQREGIYPKSTGRKCQGPVPSHLMELVKMTPEQGPSGNLVKCYLWLC
jgi:hypothetical protein